MFFLSFVLVFQYLHRKSQSLSFLALLRKFLLKLYDSLVSNLLNIFITSFFWSCESFLNCSYKLIKYSSIRGLVLHRFKFHCLMEMLAYMQFEFIPEECSFLHITHLFLNLRYSFSHFCILSIEPLDFILFAETYK